MATQNYGLPTITGNMTADVVRDMNALAEATDGAIKENTEMIKTQLASVGKTPRKVTFTQNGSWTAPEGVTNIFVTGGGGGGGGASMTSPTDRANGTAGGATSFGTLLTLSGGGGGTAGAGVRVSFPGVAGGPGGQAGQQAYLSDNSILTAGKGGNSGPYFGGPGGMVDNTLAFYNGGRCSGGGAATHDVANHAASGGGGADFVFDAPLTVVPGTSYPITIGVGGSGGVSAGRIGGRGGNGILTIEWWE